MKSSTTEYTEYTESFLFRVLRVFRGQSSGIPVKRLLEFVLPARWRTRPAPDETANAATFTRLEETDPVYRLLLDHAFVDAQNALRELMDPNCPDPKLHYWRGHLAASIEFIEGIERRRLEWRQAQQRKPEQRQRGVL